MQTTPQLRVEAKDCWQSSLSYYSCKPCLALLRGYVAITLGLYAHFLQAAPRFLETDILSFLGCVLSLTSRAPVMAGRSGLPEPLEAIHNSIGESNSSSTMTREPGSIACDNRVPLPKSEVVHPGSATSSVAVHYAFGADRLRSKVGPEGAEEVREGVGQHVNYGQCAEDLGTSGSTAKANTDEHSEGDQDGEEDDGYQRIDLDKQLRGQLEVLEAHVCTAESH
jgi:hypothetical protein